MPRTLKACWLFSVILASYGLAWLWALTLGTQRRAAHWDRVHQSNARRLAQGFARLQGVFIKAGQVLSVLGSFLPKAYAHELEVLQDAVPPRPLGDLEPRLRAALGSAARERFAHFEEIPLASASLAQVHKAVTREGQAVVVKILYPNIEATIAKDLRVLRWVFPVFQLLFPIQRSDRVLDQLQAMLSRELDYANERRNMQRLRTILQARGDVVIPIPIEDLSGPGVLTMSYEHGIKITALDALEASGIDPVQVAKILVECYFEMLLEHRVFHADPHPGNFLVQIDAQASPPRVKLVILDFGAVETVTEALARGMRSVALGGVTRDASKVLQGLQEMGFMAPGGDTEWLTQLGREYLSLLSSINIKSYAQLDRDTLTKLAGFDQVRGRLRAVMKHLEYPEGYFYVERTLALLFGLAGQLAPDKGLQGLAAPLALRALARGFGSKSRPNTSEPTSGSAPAV